MLLSHALSACLCTVRWNSLAVTSRYSNVLRRPGRNSPTMWGARTAHGFLRCGSAGVPAHCIRNDPNSEVSLLPLSHAGSRNRPDHALPYQRHPWRSQAPTDTDLDPLGDHLSAPTALGPTPEKQSVQRESPAQPKGMLQGGPRRIEADTAKGILQVALKQNGVVTFLAMPLDEEERWHW